jgi:glycosyltransferase involved in cell wall biosynthesis
LFLGRLVEIKGVDLILTAMSGMANVRLVIAGDGEKRRELEARARELSVTATFAGRVAARQRESLFAACDVVVVPSRVLAGGRTEGTPVVCLEAMAAGRVVIAARTGGLEDVIVDGQNGLLFEPGDHRLLREKLLLALSDEDVRGRISANARRRAQAYEWSRIGERFSKIIESALEKNDQPRNSGIQARGFCG